MSAQDRSSRVVANRDCSGPAVSILIKTFNEEAKIAAAIESALSALAELGVHGEVIVADSLSTDRTVEVASRFPVLVVRMRHADDRGCGAGVQLGYQYARGEFVYVLDGDMEFVPGYLMSALSALTADSSIAGVGGMLEDVAVNNAFDRIRRRNRLSSIPGDVRHLAGGGLYRRMAIESAGGHAANRNLKAYEEAELGMRLRSAGWRLIRLPVRGVRHRGHIAGTIELLARHWRSRRAMAAGVLLRSSWRHPWLLDVARELCHPLAIMAWWAALVVILWLVPASARGLLVGFWGGGILLGLCALAIVKRDFVHALTSIAHWHYGALAILVGLSYRLKPCGELIEAEVVLDGRESRPQAKESAYGLSGLR